MVIMVDAGGFEIKGMDASADIEVVDADDDFMVEVVILFKF